LFVYISAAALDRPEVQEFTRFYLQNAAALAPEVGYVASPEDVYTADMEAFEADIAGEGIPDSQQVVATPAA
jgi:phosphate transport system substrate-binding protein